MQWGFFVLLIAMLQDN